MGGDMLQGVPGGADAYLLQAGADDLGRRAGDPGPAVTAPRPCRPDGRVLVVEMVMPPGNDAEPRQGFDVLMLLANEGGRVRTEAEFRDLFAAAGLRLARVIPTASPNSILEGVPA